MEMQQGGAIREHGINIDVLDVGQVRHRVLRQVEIAEVLYRTIIPVDPVHFQADLVEGVAVLPFILAKHHDNAQQKATGDDERRVADDGHLRGEDVYSCYRVEPGGGFHRTLSLLEGTLDQHFIGTL